MNTGAFDASEMDLLGAEFAWVYGPLSVQGEYTLADFSLDDDQAASLNDDSLHFSGYYGQISYFLTGEDRNYKRGVGVFGPVRPIRNFFSPGDSRGPGAWELAARYSTLVLNDGLVMGGEMDNLTLGVNWYLNPNLRVSLNYVMSDIDGPLGDGALDILQTRFQVIF